MSSVETKPENIIATKDPEVPEEFIVPHIADELVCVLYTAVLTHIELELDHESIKKTIPSFKTEEEKSREAPLDLSINSKMLLCPTHMGKLISLVER